MKKKHVTLVAAFLLSLFPPAMCLVLAQEPQSPQSPESPYPPRQQSGQEPREGANQGEVKTYPGRITKSNGKYVLQDLGSSNSYVLDNQKVAKKYKGKTVLVTGILETDKNTIHVKKIKPAT